MSEGKTMRLNKVLRELNISLDRAVEFLAGKGHEIESRPTTKITGDVYQVLLDGFETDANKKAASKEVGEEKRKEKEAIRLEAEAKLEKKRAEEAKKEEILKAKADRFELKTVGKIDIDNVGKKPVEKKEEVKEEPKEEVVAKTEPIIEEKEPAKVEEKETPVVETPKEETPVVEKPVVEAPKVKKTVSEIEKAASKVTEKKNEVRKGNTKSEEKTEEVTAENAESIKTQYKKLDGPNFTGKKIDLKQFERPKKKKPEVKKPAAADAKKKRKRISKPNTSNNNRSNPNNRGGQGNNRGGQGNNRPGFRGRGNQRTPVKKEEPTEAEIQKQVRETLEKLQGKSSKGKGAKYRRNKRDAHREQTEAELEAQSLDNKILKVTEFVTVSEVATMMNVPVTQIISSCMMLGMMVTMNQRLDAETLVIVAEEFNYKVEFVGAEVEESIEEVEDKPEDLETRAPIITVMGHVDHGKTSLLDYIRKANVIEGESGGITQHIGAYSVNVGDQKIAFLDTPGHEAFTAMRARGAQVTDLVIIVAAADDDVMPQTKEAISHAQAAGVPIIFAINKIDKPNANPDNVKTQLSQMNLLIEEWGGNIQSQDISAKTGQGVDELLEKVLLEAEILELKANPNKNAVGTVVEAQLDKGRGYVTTILVQAGSLRVGDYILAGKHSGKVKAMFNDKGKKLKIAGPSTPVSILGLDGAPQAGDKFNVFEDEREAKQIASKRSQLQREQSVRTQKTLTLDEIGRRIALGDFKELNIILKGDVDGSVEALTDSFQKLSTEEIQVNILHKGVGAITESDVLLATASDAIIVGFNVRPQGNARAVADREEVDIRTYSIIYAAINDLKDAMEGMLSPEMKEEVVGNVEIREIYKISKVGNIAGCMVMSGKIQRDSKIRIIREGIVVHDGTLTALKRFKDDVREVTKGYDCGVQIKNFNDIEQGDIIEAYMEVAVKKKLK
ncbi:translation initiation factor IF-2 [Polaribacter reichenbachii]|uniref:Translation initiation factor IF-2 n=1 Tax=Polaribacter reichenbachii TaxID=996801 RepID=A0A1B8U2J2_9FLAO|nr:translation initiation factor IF-2 [Polaribacter reichenbachii]APZ47944.1 translation initiation factor IF-2 [Polaribacter reichenbachii]AUC18577.1 translation initiation factor IF-2 [Polaribacter reichenbachii]OBY66086.1 translation initiation factor IF-2 [Polaribacter reichenbachii]